MTALPQVIADRPDIQQNFDALMTGFLPLSGDLRMTARSTAPNGWLLCQGQSLSRASYPDLFSAIGTTYGAVDGSHFSLPDLRDRFPVGAGSSYALAATGGSASVTLTAAQSGVPEHGHTTAASSTTGSVDLTHSHPLGVGGVGIGNYAANSNSRGGTINTDNSGTLNHSHTIPSLTVNNNTAADAASSHENRPPYIAVNWMIKV